MYPPSSTSEADDTSGPATANRKPIRALHVLAALDRGGAEAWLMDVMRTTDREALLIDVCTLKTHQGAYDREFEQLGGRIYRCPLGRNPWSFARRFKRLAAEQSYDIVHSHLYFFSGWVLRAAAAAGARKRIAHIHRASDLGNPHLLRGIYTLWMRSWIEHYATDMLGASEAGMDAFWGQNWQRDARKSVIYNGIRPERFAKTVDRDAVHRELNIPAEAKILLNVGRVNWHKRQYFLVDVAQDLIKTRDDVYFVLVGDGPDRVKIEDSVREAGLLDRFRFLQAGPPEVDKYFLAADVFAFPSVSEGFGVVVIEAAAAGLYVVACDIPGVREAVTAARRKALLPLDADAKDWSRAIRGGLTSAPSPQENRLAELKDFPFTISKSIESLMQVYVR